MKIEVNLEEVFCEDSETLEEAIKREIIDDLKSSAKGKIASTVDKAVQEVFLSEIKEAVKTKVPELINKTLDDEYFIVDRYGKKTNEATTFRNEIVKKIQEEVVYKPDDYSRRENLYTTTIRCMVKEMCITFSKEFDKTVTEQFRAAAFDYAVTQLKKIMQMK